MKAHELKKKPDMVKEAMKKLENHVRFMRTYFVELEVNSEIKEWALEVMGEYGLLPNDAIIAATCRYHALDLITFDDDFRRVPWLKVVP